MFVVGGGVARQVSFVLVVCFAVRQVNSSWCWFVGVSGVVVDDDGGGVAVVVLLLPVLLLVVVLLLVIVVAVAVGCCCLCCCCCCSMYLIYTNYPLT